MRPRSWSCSDNADRSICERYLDRLSTKTTFFIFYGNVSEKEIVMKILLRLTVVCLFLWGTCIDSAEPATDWKSEEIRRFPAADADQGVAVDDEFFYTISNRQIGKYRKSDGVRVDGWKEEKTGPFIHLNAGYVKNGKLICAHSNFPRVPMLSSVEIWDAQTMKHVDSHSFGIGPGSLTWTTEKDGVLYACFADYVGKAGNAGKGPAYTQLVRYDDRWRNIGGWAFPNELIEKFGKTSASCGAFGPGGLLYVTGHDAAEIYVLDFPKAGSTLRWIATIPASLEGQAFAFDPTEKRIVYGIVRKTKEVVVIKIIPGTGFPGQ